MGDNAEPRVTDVMLAEATAAGKKELDRPRARSVSYDAVRARLIIDLVSGAVLDIPLPATERLLKATDRERGTIELTPFGLGIHWPLVDEDLYVPTLVERCTASIQHAA